MNGNLLHPIPMKKHQFGLKQIIVLVVLFAVASAVWRKVLGPSDEDRLQRTFVNAVMQRNVKGAEKAIANGADMNLVGSSPLSIAVRNKDWPMVDMLLSKGAIPLLAKDNVLASGDLTLLNKFVQYGLVLDWNDASQAFQDRASPNSILS
ncbi:MAG: hypothetical protein U0905_21400 [Pirellulales bacterium]